jgi:LL-diaminopimelate aminotransferase
MYKLAERFQILPVHLFAEVDRMKREAILRGQDVIDLGVGDPDQPTPAPIIHAFIEALKNPKNHRYPYQSGSDKFRQSVSAYLSRRFHVTIDPTKNLIPLIGSKEGIAHFPLAFVNPGDVVLGPDPAYPAYITGTVLSGATYHPMPLLKNNDYRMPLDTLDDRILERSRLIFFNYPNNPTAAEARRDDFQRLADFARRHRLIAAHDAAYQELFFDMPPPSFLQAEGALECGIEFHSLSKTFNMTGWRIGFAAGEASLIHGLTRIKTNVDTGVFLAIQEAAAFALDRLEELTSPLIALYRKRRDIVMDRLDSAGLHARCPSATIYVWAELPSHVDSMVFAKDLLKATGVVITPGSGLGQSAGNFFRISLTTDEERLAEAMKRLAAFCGKTMHG